MVQQVRHGDFICALRVIRKQAAEYIQQSVVFRYYVFFERAEVIPGHNVGALRRFGHPEQELHGTNRRFPSICRAFQHFHFRPAFHESKIFRG